jgi:hypothetical protein
MTVSEHEEGEFLARARRGFSPQDGRAERVLSSLQAALASGAEVSAGAGVIGLAAKAWWKTTVLVAIVAGFAGSAGYYVGYRAGRVGVETNQVNPVKERVVETPAPAAPPEPMASIAEAPIASVRLPATRSVPPRASGTMGSELEEEARLLARVERSLREHNPRLALGLLEELDQRIPRGQLQHERSAARVMGHCQLGSPSAARQAREFSRRNPTSAYLARVRESCDENVGARDDPATDRDASGDSPSKQESPR